jgi:triacylglycerol esterase/lipase EstA (alpha/beta hydrolase family)
VEVRFLHPKYLNVSGLFRSDAIEIVNKNNGVVLHEIPIQIYRAPVVFVHGLWGNMTNLNSIKNHFLNSGKYELKQLQLVDYKNTNASSFRENANEIKNEINSKLSELRFSLFSAGKVDIVAHSMGGILSSLYLQNDICKNGQTNDCYRNDINKLITLNTPHSGTQAANYLLNYFTPLSPCVNRVKLGLWFDKTFRGGTPRQLYDGAVKDLQCDSEAIKSLNGSSKLNKNIVPSYAISTYALFNANSGLRAQEVGNIFQDTR